MPQVTVYVRNSDLPKWKAIERKSEWLHEHLANKAIDAPKVPKVIKTKEDAQKAVQPLQGTESVTYTKAIPTA